MADNETETSTTEEVAEERSPGAASMTNPLSKPTDHVTRPGFRNAPNQGSKAQKGKRKKRRR